jgi:hypothetical protein
LHGIGALFSVVGALTSVAPATAEAEATPMSKYEPMEAIKNKDYGKARGRCVEPLPVFFARSSYLIEANQAFPFSSFHHVAEK